MIISFVGKLRKNVSFHHEEYLLCLPRSDLPVNEHANLEREM